MLNRDLLRIERDAVRQATGVLTAANDASESNEQRDARARDLLAEIVDSGPEGSRLDDDSFDAVIQAGINDLYYLGPIEELLPDTTISEIMVNAPDDVWVERAGLLQKTPVTFEDDEHVKFVINRIASADGRRCDEAQPLCDCILNRPGAIFNGSRVAATAKGIAVDHNILNIRKFRPDAVEPEDLMALGTFDQRMLEFMEAIVLGRMNVVIAGGTGSGKTTLLNACSSFIPDDQRIVTIEDAPELRLQKPHVVRKTARRPNIEGEGEITIRQLVIHALRERPDRIVVGECRGPEAFDMLQAMNSGHDGSLTTTHANNPRAALDRLQNLVQMSRAGANMPPDAIMKIITEAVDFVVEIKRLPDGSRRVNNICEVCGMQGNVPTVGSIMKFQKTGVDSNGRIKGEFRPTGSRIVSEDHKERFYSNGVEIKPGWFDNGGLW